MHAPTISVFSMRKKYEKTVKYNWLFLVVLFLTLLVCALCNVYIFKPNYGNLNAMFFLAVGNRRMEVPISYYILSLLVMCFCIGVYYFCKRFHKLSIISVLIFSLSLGKNSFEIFSIKELLSNSFKINLIFI